MAKKQKLTPEEVQELDGYNLSKSVFDDYIKTGKRSEGGAPYRIYVETVAETIRNDKTIDCSRTVRKELVHRRTVETISQCG